MNDAAASAAGDHRPGGVLGGQHAGGRITQETFPLTAQGYSNYIKKCMKVAGDDPPWSGHTGDPKTGFDEWTQFFLKNMPSAKN